MSDKKSHNSVLDLRDGHVVPPWVPGGSLRASALDRGDRVTVVVTAGSDDHYFFGA
jgi:hypothetical protein